MPKSLTRRIIELGNMQRGTLPLVAIELAESAKRRAVGADDATDLYLDYYRAVHGNTKIDPSAQSVRVNASKLRKIIEVADPTLLQRVAKVHARLPKTDDLKPLYAAMVDVCRYKLDTARTPNNAVITDLCHWSDKRRKR